MVFNKNHFKRRESVNMVGVQYSIDERTFMVENFLETNDYQEVIRRFSNQFPNRRVPVKKTIKLNVKKFHDHDSRENKNELHSGRPRTARSQNAYDRVNQALANNPRISARRNGTGVSKSTFNRITNDFKLYPYQMVRLHSLRNTDYARRIAYSRWLLNQWQDPTFFPKIIVGDEATFKLNGSVNTRNIREYAPRGQRPDFTYEVNESREKVNVWAAMCGNGDIIGPYYFDVNV